MTLERYSRFSSKPERIIDFEICTSLERIFKSLTKRQPRIKEHYKVLWKSERVVKGLERILNKFEKASKGNEEWK